MVTSADDQATVDNATFNLDTAILAYNSAIVQPSVTTDLDDARTMAADLISENAPESTTPGDHVVGSLATLSGVLASVSSV